MYFSLGLAAEQTIIFGRHANPISTLRTQIQHKPQPQEWYLSVLFLYD
ncbi:hypothetical protein P0Y35_01845 [Kiritimatiellaeota bacterium B1221]|nr:hypothetical protein [Kiritimatiellaeota bacterium B1221]